VAGKTRKYIRKLWSKDEIQLLREMFPYKNGEYIAEQLGRSLQTVRQKAHQLGLKKRAYDSWSKNETSLLAVMFPNRITQDVAKMFGRSVNSVREKAHRMRLRKTRQHLVNMGLVSESLLGQRSLAEKSRHVI
jgi:hypothetical protein